MGMQQSPTTARQGAWNRVVTLVIGPARDLKDPRLFAHVSLIAFLAWVGIGADPLSSSCYGPEEGYKHLEGHAHLSPLLALMTIMTVIVISKCYSHIIEVFPGGGGGYLVASKMLGRYTGLVSGSALLIDYVLTVTVSIAAGGDALFGLFGAEWQWLKLPAEYAAIVLLILLNLRGVKESVKVLLPIFLTFVAAFVLLIVGSIVLHIGAVGQVTSDIGACVSADLRDPGFGWTATVGILLFAYSMGAGTFTGIEAVSNSMQVMSEPKVPTGKRTLLYVSASLSFTAGGLMLAYLLLGVTPEEGKTMNQVLAEKFSSDAGFPSWLSSSYVIVVMVSSGALLFVAAQAGFIDGPRVLANMASDGWLPRRFINLSGRLATHNGIMLIGATALLALWYTGGMVTTLVVMYSINVFLTFSLSLIGMCRHWWQQRGAHPLWKRRLSLFAFGSCMCVCIFGLVVFEKFHHGGWITIIVTAVVISLCLLTRAYYNGVERRLKEADGQLEQFAGISHTTEPVDSSKPTAVVLVQSFSGLGKHTLAHVLSKKPKYFKNVVFVGIGIVDAGCFKGDHAIEELRSHTREELEKYVTLARSLGFPAECAMDIATDPVPRLVELCVAINERFSVAHFYGGDLAFRKDTWWKKFFHNGTSQALTDDLSHYGIPFTTIPLIM